MYSVPHELSESMIQFKSFYKNSKAQHKDHFTKINSFQLLSFPLRNY